MRIRSILVFTLYLLVSPVFDRVQNHLSHTAVSWQEVLQEFWALLKLLVLKVFDDGSFHEVKHLHRQRQHASRTFFFFFFPPEYQCLQCVPHLLLISLDPRHWQQQGHTEWTQVSRRCLWNWKGLIFTRPRPDQDLDRCVMSTMDFGNIPSAMSTYNTKETAKVCRRRSK